MPSIPPVPYTELPPGGLDPARFEALWVYRAHRRQAQRVLPDGRTDIVVHARTADGERIDGPVRLAIAGPTDRPREVPADLGKVSVGLRLRPAWAATCLGVPAPSLRDRVLLGNAPMQLLGPLAGPMLSATSVADLVEALRGVADRLARREGSAAQQRADRAVHLLEDGSGLAPAAIALRLAVAERTLRRDVLAAVGLPLRSLAGLARFRRALALMRDERTSLSDIALASGYSDQAHMNREFRRFGGFTPGTPAAVPLINTPRR